MSNEVFNGNLREVPLGERVRNVPLKVTSVEYNTSKDYYVWNFQTRDSTSLIAFNGTAPDKFLDGVSKEEIVETCFITDFTVKAIYSRAKTSENPIIANRFKVSKVLGKK